MKQLAPFSPGGTTSQAISSLPREEKTAEKNTRNSMNGVSLKALKTTRTTKNHSKPQEIGKTTNNHQKTLQTTATSN